MIEVRSKCDSRVTGAVQILEKAPTAHTGCKQQYSQLHHTVVLLLPRHAVTSPLGTPSVRLAPPTASPPIAAGGPAPGSVGPPTWTGACGRGAPAPLARPPTAENGSLTCAAQASGSSCCGKQECRTRARTRQRFVPPRGGFLIPDGPASTGQWAAIPHDSF